MKLHELHVRERRAGASRHRDAVARRFDGIRRVTIEPADTTGRQDDGARAKMRALHRSHYVCVDARHATVLAAIKIVGHDVFHDLIDGAVLTASISVLRIS